ncbi:hypothetical protein GDO81_007461 [Engystomops pustulosus]|uniref:Uncharacterized protein n=1 Tax=Engystomops pustulosus TaxID=76066 RepID=A0AAV7C7A2_ENGPU|nr:hypothetical protein GDO81_007461 [Engystomops pustulosus]
MSSTLLNILNSHLNKPSILMLKLIYLPLGHFPPGNLYLPQYTSVIGVPTIQQLLENPLHYIPYSNSMDKYLPLPLQYLIPIVHRQQSCVMPPPVHNCPHNGKHK